MAYLILEQKTNENLQLLLNLAAKLEIKIAEVSNEEMEDLLFAELIKKEESGELVSREEVFDALMK